MRAPNWIGDAVMSLPAVKELKRLMPEADITVLAKPRVAAIYGANPAVSRVILYEDKGRHAGLLGKIRLAGKLRAEGFTLAVLFQNAFEAAFIAALARIPERAGYASDMRGILLTRSIAALPEGKPLHDILYYLGIIKALGGDAPVNGHPPAPEIFVSKEDAAAAERMLGSGQYIGIAPGASFGPAKKWGAKKFADAVKTLSGRLGAAPVIFGGPDDEGAAKELSALLGIEHKNLAGKTSLGEFIAAAKVMRLFITNDSGPMHVAAALGVPTVAVFGSTDPALTGPAGRHVRVVMRKTECSPCFDRTCRYDTYECLESVPAQDVVSAAMSVVNEPDEKAVFLDRDGTLNEDTGYISDPAGLKLIPGAARAVKALKAAGVKVFVVTNQSGVGRGFFKESDVIAVNARLKELLLLEGAAIDGIYYCIHAPDAGCGCRKPGTGLLKTALMENCLTGADIFVVGDKATDVELAANANGRGVLVLTGKGGVEKGNLAASPAFIARDVEEAAGWIIKEMKKTG